MAGPEQKRFRPIYIEEKAGMSQQLDTVDFDSTPFWVVLHAGLFVAVLVLLCSAVFKRRQEKWNSSWFMVLCSAALLWSGAVLLQTLIPWLGLEAVAGIIEQLKVLGELFVPGLIYLHVRKQVSYRETRWYHAAATLAAPAVLFVVSCSEPLLKTHLSSIAYSTVHMSAGVLLGLYFLVSMAQSFLVLMMVFYQMPAHMRRPATYTMAGLVLFVGCRALAFVWGAVAPGELMLAATVVVLRIFYYAFGLISAANVIATSRELVFESLSTLVLVLNNDGRILDWNNKHGRTSPLAVPRYRESYAHYRQRLLSDAKGRVSPHDENIITFPLGGGEVHYMISLRKLCNEKRQLGFLAEISGVTKIYTVFRALEETATIDQLTGLYNRNAYLQRIGMLVSAENLPVLVLVGDVNNLKPTNDVYGHLAGDALLVSAAQNILKFMPPNSFAARIGGDEYVVLAPHSSAGAGRKFVESMTESFVAAHKNSGMNVGISWGYAVMSSDEEDYNAVFSRADQMMYAQKRQYARFRSSGLVPENAVDMLLPESGEQPPIVPQSGPAAAPRSQMAPPQRPQAPPGCPVVQPQAVQPQHKPVPPPGAAAVSKPALPSQPSPPPRPLPSRQREVSAQEEQETTPPQEPLPK